MSSKHSPRNFLKLPLACRFGVRRGVFYNLFLLVFVVIAPGSGWGQSFDDGLAAKAADAGSVRVIVQLKSNQAFDQPLSNSQALEDRNRQILSTQDSLLESLSDSGHAVGGLKKFHYIPFVAMAVDGSTLEELRNHPQVAGIQEDRRHFPSLTDTVDLVGATAVFSTGFTGAGWTVAILDTGVDKSHSFLGRRVVSEACYSTTDSANDAASVCPFGLQSSTTSGSGVHCNNTDPSLNSAGCDHGTHVAGIAAGNGGIAKEASIIAIQVFTKFTGSAACFPEASPCIASFTSDFISGLERVLALNGTYKIAAANLSLGGSASTTTCDATETATKAAVDNLAAVGIATVAAAGNSGQINSIGSPACISTVISVGSTDKSDVISTFSDRASFLSLLAPGESIRSSVPGNLFAVFDGTSQATPHVAGGWVLLKQAAETAGVTSSVTSVLSALQTSGVSIVDIAGSGLTFKRIQLDKAIQVLAPPVFSGTISKEGVFAPYWESNSQFYTFMVVTHPSLVNMSSQIGLAINAVKKDGTMAAYPVEFTITPNTTQRVFVVRGDHRNFNSTTLPDGKFILTDSGFNRGKLFITPIATDPKSIAGGATASFRGYPDIRMLSYWGVVLSEVGATGFTMEFIGDLHDSMAFTGPGFSGVQ